MSRPRSARGCFGKRDSVSISVAAREGKRKRNAVDNDNVENVFVEKDLSVEDDDMSDFPAAKKTLESFPCQGRRTVHLSSFAEALSSCQNPVCLQPLVLADCNKEQRYGLGSVLHVPCRHCNFLNRVDTDTRMDSKQQRGPRPFSSNKKVALGKCPLVRFF